MKGSGCGGGCVRGCVSVMWVWLVFLISLIESVGVSWVFVRGLILISFLDLSIRVLP